MEVATEVKGANAIKSLMEVPAEWICIFFWCPKKSLSIQINLSQYSCVKRSLVASSSHENLNYKTTTKLHVFKHAINPQKCFIFSYRPQTRSNNIWPIPAERHQRCLLFSLELQNSREWIVFPFECWHACWFSLPIFKKSECSQGKD